MDADWLEPNSTADSSTEPRSKVRAVGSTDKDALLREYQHGVLTAQNSRDCREAKSQQHAYLLPRELVLDSIATHKEHDEKTRGQSGHKMGPAYLHGYRVFIRKLAQEFKAKKASAEAEVKDPQKHAEILTTLENHLQEYTTAGAKKGHKIISIFKVRESREAVGILNFQMASLMEPAHRHRVECAIVEAVEHLGGDPKPGPPPRSDAERKHQANLDNLKGMLGIGGKKL